MLPAAFGQLPGRACNTFDMQRFEKSDGRRYTFDHQHLAVVQGDKIHRPVDVTSVLGRGDERDGIASFAQCVNGGDRCSAIPDCATGGHMARGRFTLRSIF